MIKVLSSLIHTQSVGPRGGSEDKDLPSHFVPLLRSVKRTENREKGFRFSFSFHKKELSRRKRREVA
jgi:hypothetical protein